MSASRFSQLFAAARWIAGIALLIAAGVTAPQWGPPFLAGAPTVIKQFRLPATADAHSHSHGASGHGAAADDHAGHAHAAHPPHAAEDAIELSAQARMNLGLTREYVRPLEVMTFRRSIRVPGLVVEKPGWTRRQVATPMTAMVTEVHARTGRAGTTPLQPPPHA